MKREQNYTAGPWRAVKDPNYGDWYIVERNTEVRKNVDNVTLQAAAPELLEALKHLMSVIDSHDITTEDCDRRGDLYCDCLHRARKPALQAIEKATGIYPPETPLCANCRWGLEKDDRYDHRHCMNPDSPEAFADVEANSVCGVYQPRTMADHQRTQPTPATDAAFAAFDHGRSLSHLHSVMADIETALQDETRLTAKLKAALDKALAENLKLRNEMQRRSA